MSDLADGLDDAGNWRSLRDMPVDLRRAIASVKIVRRNLVSYDGHTAVVYEVKFWDKLKALEMLAKWAGLFVEKPEHGGHIVLSWKPRPERTSPPGTVGGAFGSTSPGAPATEEDPFT